MIEAGRGSEGGTQGALGQIKGESMGASVAAFIVAGLIPLGLVLAGWWDARSVLIFYWAELLVMGFFTMCRILLVQTQPVGLRLLLAMFFYGMFFGLCGAYGAMIAKLVGIHVAA